MPGFFVSISEKRFGLVLVLSAVLIALFFMMLSLTKMTKTDGRKPYQPTLTFEKANVEIGDYTYTIPGDIAYIDGRETEKEHPVTRMRLSLWDSPVEIVEITTVHHGDEVELLDYQETSKGKPYVQVMFGGHAGWISTNFISRRPSEPVGEEIYE